MPETGSDDDIEMHAAPNPPLSKTPAQASSSQNGTFARVDLPHLEAVLDGADVVVEVLDARDPLSYRISHLEELLSGQGKPVILMLNKIGESQSLCA